MQASDFSHRAVHGWQSVRRARHSARLPRYLASAVFLVFLLLGVRSAFFPPAAGTAPAPVDHRADLPSQDFALSFARAYLSYDAAHLGRRERALAPYLGSQLDPDAGFSPTRGAQSVRWAEVASDQPALAGGRLITVAARVSTQRLPLYLAISVEHPRDAALRLVGYPALVGAPAISPPPPAPQREPVDDPALTEVIDRVLRNYLALAAPDLRADLTPDAQVTLPTRRLRLAEVGEVLWLGEPGSGAVLATCTATDPGGSTYTLAYELGIAFRERPYVAFIEVVPTAS
jgi:hypothetical protein